MLLINLIFTLVAAHADTYYDGNTGEQTKVEQFFSHIKPGQVLILSEIHDSASHHQNQRDILANLFGAQYPISLGMEFFTYTDQSFVDDFNADKLSEEDFLKDIKWGSNNFADYRFQVRYPHFHGGQTLALNLPREVSGHVAKNGLDSLTPDEQKLLPPNFEMGRDSYFERFREVMKEHVPADKIQNYFVAQSLWDETMAWRASEFLKAHPDHLFVIIVGDFHVAYQDGLVARLKARGVQNVLSLSQVDTTGLSDEDRKSVIAPSERYGARADFIFDTH